MLSKEFNFEYTHADFDGDLIILYNEDSCRIYNMSGTEKFDATFDFLFRGSEKDGFRYAGGNRSAADA